MKNSWLALSSHWLKGCWEEEGAVQKILIVFLAVKVSAFGTSRCAADCLMLVLVHVLFKNKTNPSLVPLCAVAACSWP